MKILRTAAFVAALCTAVPALAQQVPNHSVPVGRGAGVTGFGSALGSNGQALFGVTGGDPIFRAPSFSDLVNNISVSQMAGGVGASVSTFWRGDGTWVAISGISTRQFFDTKATAAAASIGVAINMVSTLGYTTVGDNGAASYTRVGAGPATAWRFQSADGQWWALNDRATTPEAFGCSGNGTTDDTVCLQSLTSYLNATAPTSITVNGRPGALYNVWPVAGVAPNLMVLSGLNGFVWNFNGSCIVTDFIFTGQVGLMSFGHSTNVTLNAPCYNERSWTVLTNTLGAVFINIGDTIAPFSGNFVINNLKVTGGVAAFQTTGDVATSTGVGADISGIVINNADLSNVYYGMNFQGAGDNVTATGIKGHNNGRLYFPWNVSNHKVDMIADGGPNDQMLFKVYAYPKMSVARRQLSNIRATYRMPGPPAVPNSELAHVQFQQVVPQVNITAAANNGGGKARLTVNSTADMVTGETWFFNNATGTTAINGNHLVTVIDATHVDLLDVAFVATSPAGYGDVPATIKNVSVVFDVLNDGTSGNALLATSKFDSTPAVDNATRGYEISNFEIGGRLIGYNGATPIFRIFSDPALGTWTGETINNFNIRNLVLSGTSGAVNVTAPGATNYINLENIVSDSALVWALGGTLSGFNIANVSANGVTDRNTVVPATAPASQYAYSIDGNGVISFRTVNFTDLVGSIACGQTPAYTGDVTKPSGSCAQTIANFAVTYGKFQQIAALSVAGRSANSLGAGADISATPASDGVLRESGSVLAFGPVSPNAISTVPTSKLTGTLQAAQEPAHTGGCTNSAGNLALSCVINTNMSFGLSCNLTTNTTAFFLSNGCWSGTEATEQVGISSGAVVRNLRVKVSTAPGGADTLTVHVRINGANSALTCVITGAATSCFDIVNTATFAAGDLIGLRIISSATAAATTNVNAMVTAQTTTP